MEIAEKIQTLRKQKGISQEELAGQIGVSRQAVSKWESGQSVPDPEKIISLSDFFGVTTDNLLRECEESAPRTVQPNEENEAEPSSFRKELGDELFPLAPEKQQRKKKCSDWLALLFPAAMILAILIIYFIWFRP